MDTFQAKSNYAEHTTVLAKKDLDNKFSYKRKTI